MNDIRSRNADLLGQPPRGGGVGHAEVPWHWKPDCTKGERWPKLMQYFVCAGSAGAGVGDDSYLVASRALTSYQVPDVTK